jgi:60 kDa SS-A/Ro ribonucleoprotein
MAVLIATKTYASGRGLRGRQTWEPVQRIVDALDGAFYTTFDNVPATGLRQLVAVDCSGSMMSGSVAGVVGLTPREAAAAMALVALRTDPATAVVGFTTRPIELRISPRMRLDDVMRHIAEVSKPEGTDCAVPMTWALARKLDVDAFQLYTDQMTWAGAQHPVQALAGYRKARVPGARLVTVAMVAYRGSIADPGDAGSLDVVGFDAAAPAVIHDFLTGGAARAEPIGEED